MLTQITDKNWNMIWYGHKEPSYGFQQKRNIWRHEDQGWD